MSIQSVSKLICLLLIFLSLSNTKIMAENHVYRGRYTNSSDILYTWDGKHVYSGRYTNSSAILYTWDGKHLYQGRYTNSSNILYTWDGKHIYKGR